MRMRSALLEGAHLDFAHEVLTGYMDHKGSVTGQPIYHRNHASWDEAVSSALSIKDALKGQGWRHLSTSPSVDYYAHSDEPYKHIKVATGALGLGAKIVHEDPAVGGMHGTIKMMGESYEGKEHENLAHEILASHGFKPEERSRSIGYTSYLSHEQGNDLPDYMDIERAHNGARRDLERAGWQRHSDSGDSYTAYRHPHAPHSFVSTNIDAYNARATVMSTQIRENEVAANAVSGGGVAGIGFGPAGEPGFPLSKKKKKTTMRDVLATRGLGNADV